MGRKRKLRVTKLVAKTADEKQGKNVTYKETPSPRVIKRLGGSSVYPFEEVDSPTRPLDLTITYDYSCEDAVPVKCMEEMSQLFSFKSSVKASAPPSSVWRDEEDKHILPPPLKKSCIETPPSSSSPPPSDMCSLKAMVSTLKCRLDEHPAGHELSGSDGGDSDKDTTTVLLSEEDTCCEYSDEENGTFWTQAANQLSDKDKDKDGPNNVECVPNTSDGCHDNEDGWNSDKHNVLFHQLLSSEASFSAVPTYSWQDIEEKRINALNLLARKRTH